MTRMCFYILLTALFCSCNESDIQSQPQLKTDTLYGNRPEEDEEYIRSVREGQPLDSIDFATFLHFSLKDDSAAFNKNLGLCIADSQVLFEDKIRLTSSSGLPIWGKINSPAIIDFYMPITEASKRCLQDVKECEMDNLQSPLSPRSEKCEMLEYLSNEQMCYDYLKAISPYYKYRDGILDCYERKYGTPAICMMQGNVCVVGYVWFYRGKQIRLTFENPVGVIGHIIAYTRGHYDKPAWLSGSPSIEIENVSYRSIATVTYNSIPFLIKHHKKSEEERNIREDQESERRAEQEKTRKELNNNSI